MTAVPWLSDKAFVLSLRKREYLGKDNHQCMAAGVYLYLHELWQDGVQHGAMITLEDWRDLLEYWQGQGKDIRHLEIPPELAAKLGVPLSVTKKRQIVEEEDEMPRGRSKAVQTEMPHTQGVDYSSPITKAQLDGTQNPQDKLMQDFKWKKRKAFDAEFCGHVDCNHVSAGYILGIRSTKEGKNGQIWYGPACLACIRKYHPSLNPNTLAELAHQRTGASDLALVLDLEVGEVLKRLDAARIDDKGVPLDAQTAQTVPQAPLTARTSLGALAPGQGYTVPAGTQLTGQLHPNGALGLTGVLPDGTEVEFRRYEITVGIPVKSIAEMTAEAQGALAQLEAFEIYSQEQMDYASHYTQRIQGLAAELEKKRKTVVKPFADEATKQNKPFKVCSSLLMQVAKVLKDKIDAAYVRAGQVKQASYVQAEQALATGDMQGVAVATQQASAADINLSKGISRRTDIRWEVLNPALVPQELCSWVPDPAKIQWAIDQGYYQLGEGIRVWEEGTIAARAVAP